MAAVAAEDAPPARESLSSCPASCCCLVKVPKRSAAQWVLDTTSRAPSLFERLCYCQCSTIDRSKNVAAFPDAIARARVGSLPRRASRGSILR